MKIRVSFLLEFDLGLDSDTCYVILDKSLDYFSSVQFSRSVVSDSFRPHESQHTRPPCTSPFPGVHSNSRLSSRWCHPAISSSVVPFSFCLQSLPASESFPMSQLFVWGGQSTGVSTLTRLFKTAFFSAYKMVTIILSTSKKLMIEDKILICKVLTILSSILYTFN